MNPELQNYLEYLSQLDAVFVALGVAAVIVIGLGVVAWKIASKALFLVVKIGFFLLTGLFLAQWLSASFGFQLPWA